MGWIMGFEEADPAKRGKKHAGGMIFRPGENLLFVRRIPQGCG